MATTAQLEQITKIYIGYFNRAPDPQGLNYWAGRVDAGMSLSAIASSFSVQPESTAKYPYLANPNLASPATFLAQVYSNLFNRAIDTEGANYYGAQIAAGRPVGQIIQDIISGAKGADLTIISNKTTVGLDFAQKAAEVPGFTYNTAAASAALEVINGVDATEASVTAGKAETTAFVTGGAVAPTVVALTTGTDNLAGTTGADIFTAGQIAGVATLTVGDQINGGAGSDTLNWIDTAAITGLPTGANISSIETINVTSGSSITLNTTTGFIGSTAINTNTSGAAQTITGAATQNLTVTAAAQAATAVSVNGGNNVVVNATGATTGTITVGDVTAAKGTVAVAKAIAGAGTVNGGSITIKGGTVVTSTTNATNSDLTGTTVTQGNVTVTGTADTTSVTVKQSATVAAVAAVGANVTETVAVTWQAMADNGAQSIGGLTVTNATGAGVTATQVATVANGGVIAGLTITANPTLWTVAANGATGSTFTSTTANTNVADIGGASNTSTAGVAPAAVTTQGAAITAGVAGVTAGTVSITDVNATSTTAAGTITTASLENFGAATVNSGALTTLNLAGKGTSVDASVLGALTTAANTTLAVNTNGLTTTGAVSIDSDITTLNIASSTAASTINALSAAGAKNINVSGDAILAVTGSTLTAATDIVVTNTAGFQLGGAIGAAVNFTGGAGADAVTLSNSFTKAITMGAGNDTVTVGGATVGTGGSVVAGDGTDTVVLTSALAAGFDDNATFNTKFTGFEVVRISDQLGAVTLNVTGLGGVSTVELAAGGAGGTSVISNLASNGTVKLTANSTAFAVEVKDAAFNAADVLNLQLSKSGGVLAAGTITAAGVETVNISAADAATAGSAAAINTMTLTAAVATKIVVTGNNGIDLSASVAAKVTSFDASGVVGNGTADTAANLAVTYVSDNNDVAAVVTITGGAGNDVLTGNAAKDTIIGGAGTDTIDGKAGIDILTGGAGVDTFVIGAGEAGITGTEKITDFNIALGGDKLDLTTTTLVGNQTATNVTAAVSGAVDVTATVKDGIITVAGADAALVDTIGEMKAIFELIDNNGAADTAGMVLNGQFYVLTDTNGGAVNDIINLVGVTGVVSLSNVDAANSIFIA